MSPAPCLASDQEKLLSHQKFIISELPLLRILMSCCLVHILTSFQYWKLSNLMQRSRLRCQGLVTSYLLAWMATRPGGTEELKRAPDVQGLQTLPLMQQTLI